MTRIGLYVFKERVNYHGGDKKDNLLSSALPTAIVFRGRNGGAGRLGGHVYLKMMVAIQCDPTWTKISFYRLYILQPRTYKDNFSHVTFCLQLNPSNLR